MAKKEGTKLTKEEILEAIKAMTVLGLSELVKDIEDTFGVSAAAPMMAAAPAAAQEAAPVEEKSKFDVILSSAGEKKIQVIKEIRALTGLGLKEAKAVADEAPKPVKEGISKEEAEKIKAQLEAAGATVELK
ncbi:MAG: 50S ribosomal protein L7/L12 [Actinobacteria bacterium]|nr:50S ribosomal protein L7/L12 [Actinomycetota bacterium]